MAGRTTRRALMTAAAGALGGLALASRTGAADLSTDGVKAAEAALGVAYTDKEREQLLAGLEGQLETIRALRAIAKPNSLAPAQVFDPRLPGVAYSVPVEEEVNVGGKPEPAPRSDEDIAFAPTTKHAEWLASGALTSQRLTAIYLARIAKHAPTLECMVTVMAERARAEAVASDGRRKAGRALGPLDGVPYVLKDLFDAAGAPTTWGATPYRSRGMADADSAVAAKLKAAGAVLLGKSTTGAIAYGDIWHGGQTRNPFNPREGSSGSSAGSASATAAGLCSFGIGTETLGSIVSPSHRCGATGLRPTFGRVSRAGGMALCWSLDKIGALCRSARDTLLVLRAIAGADPADPGAIDMPLGTAPAGGDVRGLRVGYDPSWYASAEPGDVAAREALKDAGATLVEIAVPAQPTDSFVLALVVEAAAAFEELTLTDRDDELRWQADQAWPNSFRRIRFVSGIDYVQVDRLRRKAMVDMHKAFEGLDAMVGPNFAGGMLTITNFTGHPQLAFRAGFRETAARAIGGNPLPEPGPKMRTPYASSLWAPLFHEHTLVRLGHAIEMRLGVAAERPALG